MIQWRGVGFRYDGADHDVLVNVDLTVHESEFVLLAGRTGSGKSTLLGTLNGLVPQFTGGHLRGDILIDGASIVGRPPREMAATVGYVGQDPLAGFVADTVEDELAYGMEQLGLDPQTMRRRVEETLDLLGIAELRGRALRTLSGGQQQRVAIGSVLTMHPGILVLDEPTSALDPTAAEDVLGTLSRLVHDLGLTLLVAEHRMERVVPFADQIMVLEGGKAIIGAPAQIMRESPVAPPVVELGRLLDWDPLPMSVREARRALTHKSVTLASPALTPSPQTVEPLLTAKGMSVAYGQTVAVRDVSLEVGRGEIVALMGRNGSGKSSLLWAVQGTGRRQAGRVDVGGVDPADVSSSVARTLVGLVPQSASDLLYLESVADECAAADAQAGADAGACRDLLDRLTPGIDLLAHPRDLSEGQKLALVLAIALSAQPAVIELDEPTRGLDYGAKSVLGATLRELADSGHGIVVATHDVEFVATIADRVLVLADGEVVSSGSAARVLAESPAFSPQVSKILGEPWLTVAQVEDALV